MPSIPGKFLRAVADALGLPNDRSRRQQQRPRAPQPAQPHTDETESSAVRPKSGGGPALFSASGFPITAADCRVCGVRPARAEYHNQFCGPDCERRMGDSLDAWHDQFEERFGEGGTVDEWRAELEERHGKNYLAEIDERAREKD